MDEEKEKLDKLLRKIEKNKRNRHKQKEKELKTRLAIQRTTASRELKRKVKASIIHIPENKIEDFVDSNIELQNDTTYSEAGNEGPKKKIKLAPKIEGFTILGADNFISKNKVCNRLTSYPLVYTPQN